MTTKQHDCRSVDYRFTALIDSNIRMPANSSHLGRIMHDYTVGGLEAATLLIDSLYEMFGNRLTIVWKDDRV